VTYEIEVGGRIRRVTLTRAGGRFAVTLDGRTWRIDAARVDANTLSLIVDDADEKGAVPLFRTDAAGAGYGPGSGEVTVTPGPSAGQLTVQVGAVPVTVAVDGRRRWSPADDPAGAGPQRITAPMPGRVVRVLVRPGDQVKARQGLVVVEAMKMENELRAGRDGTVAEVHVREGLSVDAGALLIVVQ
jgi:biotin carboxyl carrier protein